MVKNRKFDDEDDNRAVGIDMKSFLLAIRDQLLSASDELKHEEPLLKLGEVTLELNFTTTKSVEGGIRILVVGEGKYEKETIHKATVRLLPVESGLGFEAEVDEKGEIASKSQMGEKRERLKPMTFYGNPVNLGKQEKS